MKHFSLLKSLLSCIRKIKINKKTESTVSYFGNFSCWKDAISISKGYNDIEIINKATKSFKKVLSGEFKCERDTFLFNEYQYSLPLLLGLCFTQKKVNKIKLLDFGGSFASCYYRNLDALKQFDLSWTVVEQKSIVENAKKMIPEHKDLSFIKESELPQIIEKQDYNIVLFGSCLQFFEKPFDIISKVIHESVNTVILEQTPVIHQSSLSKITVQKIGKPLYESSYPAWHFAEKELLSWFKNKFKLRYRFNGPHIINNCEGFQSQLEDYVFTLAK